MCFKNLSNKSICATWFGFIALIPTFPFAIGRFSSISTWSIEYAICAILLECLFPVALASFFGSRFGTVLCDQGITLSNFQSFLIGLKISILSAVGWVLVSFLSILIIGMFLDASRFLGGIVILALLGFPGYGNLAGFGAIALRGLHRRNLVTDANKKTGE